MKMQIWLREDHNYQETQVPTTAATKEESAW